MKIPPKVPLEKQCSMCRQIKAKELFYKDKSRPDGLDKYCAECKKSIGRKYAKIPAPSEKMCSKCRRVLLIDSFTRSATSKFGRHATCKDCRNLYRKQNVSSIRESHRRRHIKTAYGIDYSEYQILLSSQNSVCAVCGKPETATIKGTIKPLAVDHSHTSGKVRGLLCSKCNLGLGAFGDDTDLMNKAILYLINRDNH